MGGSGSAATEIACFWYGLLMDVQIAARMSWFRNWIRVMFYLPAMSRFVHYLCNG